MSRPRLLPSMSVAARPAEPMKVSYISSSGSCLVLTRQIGCLGTGRSRIGIFSSGTVCLHRGSCSDDGFRSGVGVARLRCGVAAVANDRDALLCCRLCSARVHLAQMKGAREGAIG